MFCFVQGYEGGWSVPSLSSRNSNFTPTSLRLFLNTGTNVTLEGSQDPHSGWVDSHGQQVREKLSTICGCALIKVCQWWNVMQKSEEKVGRPTGWSFLGITKGEIRYMKVSQVSVGVVPPALQGDSISVSLSP